MVSSFLVKLGVWSEGSGVGKGLGIVRHASRDKSLLGRSHREEEKATEKGPVKYAE